MPFFVDASFARSKFQESQRRKGEKEG